jgi:hypothetical protein
MQDYYTKLDKRNSTADSDSSHSPPSSRQPSPMTPPRQRRAIRSELSERVRALSRSPPETPSAAVKIAKEVSYELERAEARNSIQAARIRELQAAEKGRNKKGDRRRPPGEARIFDQAVLNQLREARDERDRQKSSHGRGVEGVGGEGEGEGEPVERAAVAEDVDRDVSPSVTFKTGSIRTRSQRAIAAGMEGYRRNWWTHLTDSRPN